MHEELVIEKLLLVTTTVISRFFFNFQAFNSVRQARAVARLWGIRAKKAKEAEADDLSKPAKK